MRTARDTPAVVVTGLLFLLSGAAALVYQVAWQRLLALHSGVGLYSVAMIVAAFMAGLGIGSQLGGRLSTRFGGRVALVAFASIEVAIGAFGAASTYLYYDWLYPYAVHLTSPSWQAGMLHLAALLPPTVLMGMSLPFLVRSVVTDVARAGRRIGWLYGINVLGAAVGALATPWLLLPRVGLRGAVFVAAGANLIVGTLAVLLALVRKGAGSEGPSDAAASREAAAGELALASQAQPGVETPGGRPLTLWLSLYTLSGFIALSLELVWFRLVDVAVKSTAFTFGSVLSVYLLGSAIGALFGAATVERVRRPLRAFLLLQCAILVIAALPVIVAVALPPELRRFSWFVNYWAGYGFFPLGHAWDRTSVLRLYVQLPLVLFFVPTVLMGVSFPVLQRAVHDDPLTSGRKVGALQAANIAGCTAGSLIVGLLFLDVLGTSGTLRFLVALGIVFAAVGMRYYGRAFVAPALLLLGLAVLVPGPERLWRRLHGIASHGQPAYFDEDATSVVALTPDRGQWRLSVNGKGNSFLPYGGGHTVLGAVPAIVHQAPLDVAIVGLGSGDTAWAASCRRETRSTAVFEISSPQPRILRRLATAVEMPDALRFLQDPRVRILIEDGRKALEALEASYDLIEADATWPETGGSGNLYSLEFFRSAARRLKPGGVMCTWAPTERIKATFMAAFPYVLEHDQAELLVGSIEPLRFAPAAWHRRSRAVEAYLGSERLAEVQWVLAGLRPAGPPPPVRLNRDLFPRDEYASR